MLRTFLMSRVVVIFGDINVTVQRREKLATLGRASGVWKAVIKLVSGVPQALLDFIQTINDEQVR